MAHRILRPRAASQYANDAHGRRESATASDEHLFNHDLCRIILVRPRFKEGPLVIRPWPALDPSKPEQLLPGRKSLLSRGMSEWIVRVPIARNIGLNESGNERASFGLYEPWLTKEKSRTNPFRILYFACYSANKSGAFGNGEVWQGLWNPIMLGGKDRGAELTGPTAGWFMQGAVYFNGDKDYTTDDRNAVLGLADGDDLPVIQLTASSGDELMNMLDEQKEGADPTQFEATPWQAFRYGDPVGSPLPAGGVAGGLFITVFNPKRTRVFKMRHPKDPTRMIGAASLCGQNVPLATTSWDGQIEKAGGGYELALGRRILGTRGGTYAPDMAKDAADCVRNKWQFWWDDANGQKGLIRIPSVEEQCLLIAKAFQSVPALLEFGWYENPEFFTDDVKAVLRSRRAAVMPGESDEFAGGGAAVDDDDTPSAPPPARAPRAPRCDPTQPAPMAAVDDFGLDDETAGATADATPATAADDDDLLDGLPEVEPEVPTDLPAEDDTAGLLAEDAAADEAATTDDTASVAAASEVGATGGDPGEVPAAEAEAENPFAAADAADTAAAVSVTVHAPAAPAASVPATPLAGAADLSPDEQKLSAGLAEAAARAAKRASVPVGKPATSAVPVKPAASAAPARPAASAPVVRKPASMRPVGPVKK